MPTNCKPEQIDNTITRRNWMKHNVFLDLLINEKKQKDKKKKFKAKKNNNNAKYIKMKLKKKQRAKLRWFDDD